MPIIVEIENATALSQAFDKVFDYFRLVDEKFSTYKDTSEVSRINRGEILSADFSDEMKNIFLFAEQTKKETKGYFDITKRDGMVDPSGLVKGWAILNASKILERLGVKSYYIEAGGDIQVAGKIWKVGIRNPFKSAENIKVLFLKSEGIATSGTYERGQHIYNPHGKISDEIVSLTVIGPNIYEADRFATAAFAMGRAGIAFIEKLSGFEGFMIDKNGIGTETSGFEKYTAK